VRLVLHVDTLKRGPRTARRQSEACAWYYTSTRWSVGLALHVDTL